MKPHFAAFVEGMKEPTQRYVMQSEPLPSGETLYRIRESATKRVIYDVWEDRERAERTLAALNRRER